MNKVKACVSEYLSIETIVGPDLNSCFHGGAELGRFKSCLKNIHHISAFKYWLSLVRQQVDPMLPKWSTFKPHKVASELANVMVVELSGDDWTIRVIGENLIKMFRQSYAVGEKLAFFDVQGYSDFMAEQDKQLNELHCPLLESGEVPILGRQFLKYTSLLLPFRKGDLDEPDKLITVVYPYDLTLSLRRT